VSAAAPLEIRGLRASFATARGTLTAVDGIDLNVKPGEVLGLVGESGSGKSVALRSILGLVRAPGRVEGSVTWRGRELVGLPERDLRQVRGREIAMIFQEPMTALNPVLTVGRQIGENLKAHTALGRRARTERAVELLDQVGIPAAAARLGDYPHQFSGGMRQRVMIAIALASSPGLLLADEPTTALDVTIQDQILRLLLRLRVELGMSIILVTHDLGVVAETCDRVAVMYAGRITETAPVRDLFASPRHAYTAGLLGAVPSSSAAMRAPLRAIDGAPPMLTDLPDACAFAPRCWLTTAACLQGRPPLARLAPERASACIHHQQVSR
jgi:peptide/nickel transport system ATP-binding protein